MKVADVRVILADIPVKRPHKMSFTTLETVNFAFVRVETSDGLMGWGEAACLGGPTWSEESSESVAVTIERYIAPWLVGRDATRIEALSREMARRVQGNPFARAAVEMALWDLNGRALGVPRASPARGPGARERAALVVARGRELGRGSRRGAREGGAGSPHLQDQDGRASGRPRRRARPAASRRGRARRLAPRRRQPGLGPAHGARAIRALEPYHLDFVEQPSRAGTPRDGRDRAAVTVPIMADESCCSPHDALAIARLGGVGILALKLTKSAGILGTMAIAGSPRRRA